MLVCLREEHHASMRCPLSVERPDFHDTKGLWRSSSFAGVLGFTETNPKAETEKTKNDAIVRTEVLHAD